MVSKLSRDEATIKIFVFVLYCIRVVLYFIVLHCIVLHYIALYCIALYCIVLYSRCIVFALYCSKNDKSDNVIDGTPIATAPPNELGNARRLQITENSVAAPTRSKKATGISHVYHRCGMKITKWKNNKKNKKNKRIIIISIKLPLIILPLIILPLIILPLIILPLITLPLITPLKI